MSPNGNLVTFRAPRHSGGDIGVSGLATYATGGPSGLFSFLVGKTLGKIFGGSKAPPGYGMRDVVVDLEAGTVKISDRATVASKSGDLSRRYARGQEVLLQQALMTGVVPASTNSVYRPVATMIANLHGELASRAPTPPEVGERPMSVIVPPGGFAGFAQQVPATQRVLATGSRATRTVRRRKRRKAATRKAKRASSGRKLKFGSPAWRKKYMKKRRG